MSCIFCKIANGEIPSATLYEDADFRVILDLGPASKGHALILPKEHYDNLYEIPEELAAKAMKAFVMQAAGRTDEEAGMLLSLMGQMAVCQVVDPKKTIRMELPLSVLEAWGYRLP